MRRIDRTCVVGDALTQLAGVLSSWRVARIALWKIRRRPVGKHEWLVAVPGYSTGDIMPMAFCTNRVRNGRARTACIVTGCETAR